MAIAGEALAAEGVGRKRAARAFTLVELLIVLVLIAVLAGSAVVALQGRPGEYALRFAGKDLAAAIRSAARRAAEEQHTYRVAFFEDHRAYRIEVLAPESDTGFVPASGKGGGVTTLPEGVSIESVACEGTAIEPLPEELLLAPDGNGFCGVITLRNRRAQCVRIEVMYGTGQVAVTE